MPFLRLVRKLLCAETVDADDEQADPKAIKGRGWRQWSCVSTADLPVVLRGTALAASLPGLAEGARLLVVSQSCDLVHHCYAAEPAAEAYVCEPLGPGFEPDGNRTAGKNPRELHLALILEDNDRWYRIRSSGRVLFPRRRLARIDPDPTLSAPEASIRILQRWVMNRVVRTAFPDAFNDRTEKALAKLEKRLKRHGGPLLGLYVNVTPWEELADDESYDVDFVGIVDENLALDQRTALEKVLGEIAAAYEAEVGIECCDYRIEDEGEAALSLLRTHRLFPLDYFSLRDKPGGELPPPG